MKSISRFLLFFTMAVLAVTLTAGQALCAGKLKVGFVFSMTGGAASYGASQKEGAQLAIAQINAAAGSGMQIETGV